MEYSNDQQFTRKLSANEIYQILTHLNNSVIEEYLQKRIGTEEICLIDIKYFNSGEMQSYHLYYDKRLLGHVAYGYVPFAFSLTPVKSLYHTEVSKDVCFFKASFVSAHLDN